jgi:ubiquinone/menaquinone biosynthesis C-methylase UbiE
VTVEKSSYAEKLRLADLLREPVIRRAVGDLHLKAGINVLDAGCGIGSHLPLLAEQVGPSGHVTGLDISGELLSIARQRVHDDGLENRVRLVQGDVNNLPFAEESIDCVVSVDCVGYPFALQPVALLQELGRVVVPGGAVAIMGWSHQQLLPGYPLLESRLNTASSLVGPFHPEGLLLDMLQIAWLSGKMLERVNRLAINPTSKSAGCHSPFSWSFTTVAM